MSRSFTSNFSAHDCDKDGMEIRVERLYAYNASGTMSETWSLTYGSAQIAVFTNHDDLLALLKTMLVLANIVRDKTAG